MLERKEKNTHFATTETKFKIGKEIRDMNSIFKDSVTEFRIRIELESSLQGKLSEESFLSIIQRIRERDEVHKKRFNSN